MSQQQQQFQRFSTSPMANSGISTAQNATNTNSQLNLQNSVKHVSGPKSSMSSKKSYNANQGSQNRGNLLKRGSFNSSNAPLAAVSRATETSLQKKNKEFIATGPPEKFNALRGMLLPHNQATPTISLSKETKTSSVSQVSSHKKKSDLVSPSNRHISMKGAQSLGSREISGLSSPSQNPQSPNPFGVSSADIRNVALDLPNQNVVRADTERSRFIGKEHFDIMQQLLTFYCKHESISYKQGINEIMSPFLWLSLQKQQPAPSKKQPGTSIAQSRSMVQKKSKYNTNFVAEKERDREAVSSGSSTSQQNHVDLEEPFLMTQAFVERFQTNLFVDDEFCHLQACLATFKILLKYHNPDLARYLEHNYVTCEMYAIPWFITYFSSKIDTAELVIEFWDRIAQKGGDFTFIFFFAVALVLNNEMRIMSVDSASLPEVMTTMRISSMADLDRVIQLAETLDDNTPYSFKQLPEIQKLSQKQSSSSLKSIMQSLERLTCMPVLPAELFFYAFPGEIECPNPECSNSLTWKRALSGDVVSLMTSSVHADPQMSFISGSKNASNYRELQKMDSEEQIQSGITSFISSQNINTHSKNSNSQTRYADRPIETESNLNYEQDHQESPIDLINETARMKHLNSEDFKSLTEKQLQKFNDPFQAGLLDSFVDINNARQKMPELCLRCTQKAVLTKQIEAKQELPRQPNSTTSKNPRSSFTSQKNLSDTKVKDPSRPMEADSFEELSTDLLYNKIRFIIVDCRITSLQQEVSLPHCLNLQILAASKAEQLRQQIEKLVDYKDSYHICLLGLDRNQNPDEQNDRKGDGKSQDKKISIKKFHEFVLRFTIETMQTKGFKHISSLPGGFQQVHDLCKIYGFQLIDHDEGPISTRQSMIQNEVGSVTPTLTGNSCYHCMVQMSKRKSIDSHSIVTKRYGSMIDHLRQNTFGQEGISNLETVNQQPEESRLQDKDDQLDYMEDDVSQVHDTTVYNGQKFDLIGFSDYFPFGLRQMYEAASSINKMLVIRRAAEEVSTSQAQLQKNGEQQELSTDDVSNAPIYINEKSLQQENQRKSRYVQQKQQIRQQSSEEGVYTGGLAMQGKSARGGVARSAGKSGSASRKACYQNQQHLQLQSQYKLMSKVPDFQSQFLNNKGESSASWSEKMPRESNSSLNTVNTQPQDYIEEPTNQTSPVKRNRPRITNEVQPQDKDLAHFLMQLQEQVLPEANQSGTKPNRALRDQNTNHERSIQDDGFETGENLSCHLMTNEVQSTNTKTQDSMSGVHSSQSSSSNLPILSPQQESYLLNGIINQVQVTSEAFWKLIQTYKAGHVFSAVRLPARKKTFQLKSQPAFNYTIPSRILITPFTVAVLHKNTDLEVAFSQGKEKVQPQSEEIDQADFDESDFRQTKEVKPASALGTDNISANGSTSQQSKSGSTYATLQSRFFMYDLIKITSRKSTTKIITFYYRIPKIQDYNAEVLEQSDILQKLNSKPAVRYAFAFKRQEFEEVSMSFEFELEEEAKMCIASVSSLYKKLKDSQKRIKQRSTAVSDNSAPSQTGVEGPGQQQVQNLIEDTGHQPQKSKHPGVASISSGSSQQQQIISANINQIPVPTLQPHSGQSMTLNNQNSNDLLPVQQQVHHQIRKSAGSGSNIGQQALVKNLQHHVSSASQPSSMFNSINEQAQLSAKRNLNK